MKILIAVLLLLSFNAQADLSLLVNYGVGVKDGLIQYKSTVGATQRSIGLSWSVNKHLEIENYLTKINFYDNVTVYTTRPVFNFWQKGNHYYEFGAGGSYFKHKDIGTIQLSTNLQFSLIAGVGFYVGSSRNNRVSFRYNHYSNASIKLPNVGLDTISIDWKLRIY